MLFVVAIIAILIDLLVPAVQDVRDAAQTAQQYPRLQDVARSVLRTVDESFEATLGRAETVFEASLRNHTLPDRGEVAAVLQTLTEKETALEAARRDLAGLGSAQDPNYRRAYLHLRDALDDTLTVLHETNERLSQLLRIMGQGSSE
jgi:hypothetical protein